MRCASWSMLISQSWKIRRFRSSQSSGNQSLNPLAKMHVGAPSVHIALMEFNLASVGQFAGDIIAHHAKWTSGSSSSATSYDTEHTTAGCDIYSSPAMRIICNVCRRWMSLLDQKSYFFQEPIRDWKHPLLSVLLHGVKEYLREVKAILLIKETHLSILNIWDFKGHCISCHYDEMILLRSLPIQIYYHFLPPCRNL
jgi:hypothetical protein